MIMTGVLRHTHCLKVNIIPPSTQFSMDALASLLTVLQHKTNKGTKSVRNNFFALLSCCLGGVALLFVGNGLYVDWLLWHLGGVGYVGEALGILAVAVCMSVGSLASWCWW